MAQACERLVTLGVARRLGCPALILLYARQVLCVHGPETWESQPPSPEDTVTAVLLVVVTGVPLETVPVPGSMAVVNHH